MEIVERINPIIHRTQLMYPEHIARYMFAAQVTNGKSVIDCSCGNGYGSNYLASHGAQSVLGIDISPEAIDFSVRNYSRENLQYMVGDGTRLETVESDVADVYTCFETIEHIADTGDFMSEALRVLKPDGMLVMSCPNDNVFNPHNPYHVDTYTVESFVKLLKEHFTEVQIFAQNNTTGTSIIPSSIVADMNEDSPPLQSLSYAIDGKELRSSDTWLAVCSNVAITRPIESVMTYFSTYSEYIKEIQSTINSLYEENQRLARAWDEHVGTIRNQQEELNKLSDAYREHEAYIKSIERENERLGKAQDVLGVENRKLAAAWEEHVAYIHKLEDRLR